MTGAWFLLIIPLGVLGMLFLSNVAIPWVVGRWMGKSPTSAPGVVRCRECGAPEGYDCDPRCGVPLGYDDGGGPP